jgi:hypothetical protein
MSTRCEERRHCSFNASAGTPHGHPRGEPMAAYGDDPMAAVSSLRRAGRRPDGSTLTHGEILTERPAVRMMRLQVRHVVDPVMDPVAPSTETEEPITVTPTETIYRRRVRVLEHAAETGNVSQLGSSLGAYVSERLRTQIASATCASGLRRTSATRFGRGPFAARAAELRLRLGRLTPTRSPRRARRRDSHSGCVHSLCE